MTVYETKKRNEQLDSFGDHPGYRSPKTVDVEKLETQVRSTIKDNPAPSISSLSRDNSISRR